MPSLQLLSVTFCPDELNQIVFPDLSPAKLKRLDLFYNSLDDEAADNIVAKLIASTSAESLEELNLNVNLLTKIPSQVGPTFPLLKVVYLDKNNISHIPSSSFNFASPLIKILSLSSNNIMTIGSGAFQGNYMN